MLHESLLCNLIRPEEPGEEPWLWQAIEILFNDDFFDSKRSRCIPTLQELALE